MIKTREVRKIYSNKDYSLDSSISLSFFDLHLILLRNIKNELETKIDTSLTLKTFSDKGLLKNHKYPLFILKDNKASGLLNMKKLDKFFFEDLVDTYEETDDPPNENSLIFYYQQYLSRANPIYGLKYSEVSITYSFNSYLNGL